jgi:hypothetical protein
LPWRAFPAWIGYEFWQSRYGGSPSVIGTTIRIGVSATEQGDRLRIVGVLPRRASIPLPFVENSTDVWYLLERDSASGRGKLDRFLDSGTSVPELAWRKQRRR